MHLGLLASYGQGHVIPISCAVSRLRGTFMHDGLLGGLGQGHVSPISHAVSRLRGKCMHHGLLGGRGQGHVIPISHAVSKPRGLCMHHGLLRVCGQGAGSCALPLRAHAGTSCKLELSAKLSTRFSCARFWSSTSDGASGIPAGTFCLSLFRFSALGLT